MEITCNRCKTEYEFDDALVSERGTTVRCTNCGEQFKVYRSHASEVPEQWVVQRRDGRELVFTNLRDLQRAITNLQVGRHDTLARGNAPPRPLGSIAELEPFFVGRLGPSSQKIEAAPNSDAVDTLRRGAPPEELPARSGRASRPPPPAAPPPPLGLGAAPNVAPRMMVSDPDIERTMLDPRAQPRISHGTAPYAPVDLNSAPQSPLPGSGPPSAIGPSYDPPPSDSYDGEQDWFGEPRFSTAPTTRSRALRWLVVLILLGFLGVAGATVGRKYIAMVVRPTPAPQGTEGRVETFLDEGDRALSDGDLDAAKEAFDKASALAERDARVLVDLARFDAVRADVDWLKVRILSIDLPDALAVAKRQAQQSAQRALRAAEKAADIAPDDPRTARAKIDALRLTGDLGQARTLVARVGPIAAQPETAYVLAALDLSEESPNWPAVVDRLKTAAAGESNLQRARGALVYTLVRSGDLQLARSELDKIAASARPYPLLPELKAFVARALGPAAVEVDAGKRDAAPAAAGLDTRAPPAAPGGEAGGDFRAILQQASQAAAARNYDRAEQLYRVALAKNPGDTEAVAGLGDVARARGNPSLAKSYYERVLATNPHYVPSLAALADLKWEGGDRAGAVKLYRDLLDATSDGTLAKRARDRIAQAESGPANKPARPSRPSEPTSPPPSPSPDEPPEIDTSDLPGFKR